MDLFRHFSKENHHGILEDIRDKIIDRLVGGDRIGETYQNFSKSVGLKAHIILSKILRKLCLLEIS